MISLQHTPHHRIFQLHARAAACSALLIAMAAHASASPARTGTDDDTASLSEVVVTAVHEHSPVHVVADPKQPRQPVPASDAADYLKSIPGFSAVRSGGSNSDPVFRGQFGSRLPILTNGSTLLGACPSRMDSPSSYISPETFDELDVVKGPQTVIWGPGASAGVVRFDRTRPELDKAEVRFSASATAGTAARSDQNADLLAGTKDYYVRFTANHSQAKDYKDGDGKIVPSHYDKWNADVALGLTPDADTWIELSAGAGDGEARYGGRGMDGTQFRRDSLALRFEKRNITDWFSKFEAQVYYNRADHVMDNFTLRTFSPGGGMSMPMASNVRRTTSGLRVAGTFELAASTSLVAGVDAMNSPHYSRKGSLSMPYQDQPRVRNARFSNTGLFAELTQRLDDSSRMLGGLRIDHAQAWRYPVASSSSGMSGMGSMGSSMGGGMNGMDGGASTAASNHRQRNALPSGFLRWERNLQGGATVYAGVGHVQRFPDYWELIAPANSAADSGNAFGLLRPEKTTQIDIGASIRREDWQVWTSAYAGVVKDFILFDYSGMSSAVRNVDARTAGLEVGGSWRMASALTAQATLAYSWAENRSDHRPLAQTPPLEARLGLDYTSGAWNAGALWRLVASQHRYAAGTGNVVGKDFGPSAGFGVLSLNAGYRVNEKFKLIAGIDNLFDKTYSEHLNLAGSSGFGYPGSVRINEPGRTLWVRGDVKF